MSAYFIRDTRRSEKPHVISQGLRSDVSTIYQTACGQIIRYRSDFPWIEYRKPGEVAPDDVCGICRTKTTQEIRA